MSKSTTKKTAASKAKKTIEVEFEFDRATKNTLRFAEVADPPVIGTLYVQKSAFSDGKEPSGLSVVITVN